MTGLSSSPTDSDPHVESARISLRLAVFAICLSFAQAAVMVALRTGLPTPTLSYTLGPAILTCTLLGPTLWALRAPGRAHWIGPIAVPVFLASFVLISFGVLFQFLVIAAALLLLARALMVLRPGSPSPRQTALWLVLFLAVVIVSTAQVAGIKYVNYVADQLALAGRTDGDMLMHAAMANALRYYNISSTGIDGLNFTPYHFGVDILMALLSRGMGLDILLAMIVIKVQILIPLMSIGAGWGGLVIGRTLMPHTRVTALALATAGGSIAFLLQSTPVFNLVTYSDPLLLSGVFMLLIAPTVIAILNETTAAPADVKLAWLLAICGILLIGIAKISNGFVWAGLIAFWAWRRYGLRWDFWIVSAAAGLVFIPSYLVTVDQEGARTILFGTPYFVERGFAKGLYFEPLRIHFQALAAILWLAFASGAAERRPRRFLIESLAIAILVGNLPGLLMWIDGGDAAYFMFVVAWFSLPILTALLADLSKRSESLRPMRRRLVWSGMILASIACVLFGLKDLRLGFNIFTAYNALLHTGDRSFYDDDSKKGWREDGRRAWATYGLGVFDLPPPPQAGKSLVDALRAFKTEIGNTGAAYLAPQSDYWDLVSDCDGKVTYPMSMAGVPVIDGYLPVQSVCPQQFSLRGYGGWGAAPETRSDVDDAVLCSRAREKGFSTVLRIESLADRSRDRKIDCP